MANYNGHYTFQVTDINGDVATIRIPWHGADTITASALALVVATFEADIQALTNGKVTRQGFSFLFNEAQYLVGTTPPTNAEYSSVTDGAKLSFADGVGERSALTIPAPIEAAFGANSNVVDSTQAAVATLIGDIAAHAVSTSGSNFNLYKGGVKTARHSRRRATRLIP